MVLVGSSSSSSTSTSSSSSSKLWYAYDSITILSIYYITTSYYESTISISIITMMASNTKQSLVVCRIYFLQCDYDLPLLDFLDHLVLAIWRCLHINITYYY